MRTTQQKGKVSGTSARVTPRRDGAVASRPGRHRLLYLTSALTAFVLFFALPAAADVLPPHHLAGDIFFNLGPRLFPNDFGTTSLADARFGSVSLTASGTPSPSLIADANIGPNLLPSISGRASWLLDYAFEIVGPPGTVPVLIDVAGGASGVANTGASFAVESRWDLLDGGSSLAGDDIRSGQLTGSFGQGFSRTVGLTLAANRPYSVFMLADAFSAATLDGSRADAHAFVDPVFSFGPGVDPLVYSFEFSTGIGNAPVVAAVPEPASLVLLGAGLLCLGLVLCRRSRQPARTSALRSGKAFLRQMPLLAAFFAFSAVSAHSQSFTTRQIPVSRMAALRSATPNTSAQGASTAGTSGQVVRQGYLGLAP